MTFGQQVGKLFTGHTKRDHERQVVQQLERSRCPVLFVRIAPRHHSQAVGSRLFQAAHRDALRRPTSNTRVMSWISSRPTSDVQPQARAAIGQATAFLHAGLGTGSGARRRNRSTPTYSPSWEPDLHQHPNGGVYVRQEGG
jgi:hypothetical protein